MHRLTPSTGGIVLELIVEEPPDRDADEYAGSVILCHPHPVQGGTMRHPILGAIAKEALAARLVTVRFNFRGVGESTGNHDDGIAEVSDVAAVADFVNYRRSLA